MRTKQMYKYIYCLALIVFANLCLAQNVTLYQQFNGNYGFTFFGNTLNVMENNIQPELEILSESSADLVLNPGDQIHKAYLYWAGSGLGDFSVQLNDLEIQAERTFIHSRLIGGQLYHFFSAFKDITSYLQTNGTGTYTFSGLDNWTALESHFLFRTNFAGWAVIVVYENANLPINQLNVYDGLQGVPNSLSIQLTNLNVIDNVGAKIGFLAWEGDSTLAVTESLKLNGNIISDPPLNPANNAFNSTNSITGNTELYNMDLDIYDIQNNINIGDTDALIELTSGQDFVMINAVVTLLNSQLPDATIEVNAVEQSCDSRTITIEYTVENANASDELPAQTPIAFYANQTLIGTAFTQNVLPINGSESGIITLNIPQNIGQNFILKAVVDDNGTGAGVVTELNENNNLFEIDFSLWIAPEPIEFPVFEICQGCGAPFVFDIASLQSLINANEGLVIAFYNSNEDAENQENEIILDESISFNQANTTLFVRISNEQLCYRIQTLNFNAIPCPPDLSIIITSITTACDQNTWIVNFDVSNVVCVDDVAAGIPLTWFVNDEVWVINSLTQMIAAGSTVSFTFEIPIPQNLETDAVLGVQVNSSGVEQWQIDETDYSNNSFEEWAEVKRIPEFSVPAHLESCNLGNTRASFDISILAIEMESQGIQNYSLFENETDALQNVNHLSLHLPYIAEETPKQLYIRVDNTHCFEIKPWILRSRKCEPIIYNFVSANQNGFNEVFYIENLIDVFFQFRLTIYNRWGHKVWSGGNNDGFWDGTSKHGTVISGEKVPEGTYFYVLELNDPDYPAPLTGYVYITR